MHSNMNADEVVKGLQYLSGVLRAQAWHKARERKKEFATTCSEAASLIENLQKQLADAQRRADAAVEDLRRNRKYKCDCCHYANKQGQYTPCRDCQSPISNHGDLWQWRGPQE